MILVPPPPKQGSSPILNVTNRTLSFPSTVIIFLRLNRPTHGFPHPSSSTYGAYGLLPFPPTLPATSLPFIGEEDP